MQNIVPALAWVLVGLGNSVGVVILEEVTLIRKVNLSNSGDSIVFVEYS